MKKIVISLLTVLLVLLFAFSTFAEQDMTGIWVGGNEALLNIYQLNKDKTGTWTLMSLLEKGAISTVSGTWKRSGNDIIFTNKEESKIRIGNMTVTLNKQDVKLTIKKDKLERNGFSFVKVP